MKNEDLRLMTVEDVARRLKAGEDPLDLSIEAWKGKLAWLESGQPLPPFCISVGCCGLCMANNPNSLDCEGCALYKAGYECTEPSSPYDNIHSHQVRRTGISVPSTPASVQDARRMLQALRKTKSGHHLMSHEEIVLRLNAGEDSLYLSLEHWDENLAALRRGETLSYDRISGRFCALCIEYIPLQRNNECVKCPLFQSLGGRCDDSGPWSTLSRLCNFDSGLRLYLEPSKEAIEAAIAMIQALTDARMPVLQQAKEKKAEDETEVGFMETGVALEMVHRYAGMYLTFVRAFTGDIDFHAQDQLDLALNVAHDFIVNNFPEED